MPRTRTQFDLRENETVEICLRRTQLAEYQVNSIILNTQPNIHISDHYVMAIRCFFLGSLAALSVPFP